MKKLVLIAILSVFVFGEDACKTKLVQEKIENLRQEVMDNFTTLREIKCENNILTHDSVLSVDLEKISESERLKFLHILEKRDKNSLAMEDMVKNRYCNSGDFVKIRNANLTFRRIIRTQNLDIAYKYEASNKDCK